MMNFGNKLLKTEAGSKTFTGSVTSEVFENKGYSNIAIFVNGTYCTGGTMTIQESPDKSTWFDTEEGTAIAMTDHKHRQNINYYCPFMRVITTSITGNIDSVNFSYCEK